MDSSRRAEVSRRSNPQSAVTNPRLRLFLVSFLVLFLEVALIRWMPAYIRLLSYFSNFILLASFLGIGVGCLLANRRRDLFMLFPLLQLAVVAAANRLRLEIAVPSTTSSRADMGQSMPRRRVG